VPTNVNGGIEELPAAGRDARRRGRAALTADIAVNAARPE